MTVEPGDAPVAGIGLDLVDVDRMGRALHRRPGLVRRLFVAAEQEQIVGLGEGSDAAVHGAAVLFAVKEAVMKALGGGIYTVGFTDIAVSLGPPASVELSGRAAGRAAALGVEEWEIRVDPGADGPGAGMVATEVVARRRPEDSA